MKIYYLETLPDGKLTPNKLKKIATPVVEERSDYPFLKPGQIWSDTLREPSGTMRKNRNAEIPTEFLIFKADDSLGHAVMTLSPIKKGEVVALYSGEIILRKDLLDSATGKQQPNTTECTINLVDDNYVLTATKYIHIAKLVNHAPSCSAVIQMRTDFLGNVLFANLEMQQSRDGLVCLKAIRDIPPYSVLATDYGLIFFINKKMDILLCEDQRSKPIDTETYRYFPLGVQFEFSTQAEEGGEIPIVKEPFPLHWIYDFLLSKENASYQLPHGKFVMSVLPEEDLLLLNHQEVGRFALSISKVYSTILGFQTDKKLFERFKGEVIINCYDTRHEKRWEKCKRLYTQIGAAAAVGIFAPPSGGGDGGGDGGGGAGAGDGADGVPRIAP